MFILWIEFIKQKFKENFSMESSFGHLMKVTKDFYLVSIGINEINYGIKNPKRFKISIMHQSRNSN